MFNNKPSNMLLPDAPYQTLGSVSLYLMGARASLTLKMDLSQNREGKTTQNNPQKKGRGAILDIWIRSPDSGHCMVCRKSLLVA